MFKITQAIRDVVAESLGYEVGDDRIRDAVAGYEAKTAGHLRKTLQANKAAFEQLGGRGVDLAEEIDSLRIAIAARAAK
jgi:hypothetical protein